MQHWAPRPTKRVTYLSRDIYPDEYTPHDAVNRLKQPKISILAFLGRNSISLHLERCSKQVHWDVSSTPNLPTNYAEQLST